MKERAPFDFIAEDGRRLPAFEELVNLGPLTGLDDYEEMEYTLEDGTHAIDQGNGVYMNEKTRERYVRSDEVPGA